MNKLKLLAITGITGIIIILFFTISLFLGKAGTPEKQGNTPLPTAAPTQQINVNDLYVVGIIPEDTTKTYLPVQPIQVTFTQAVSPSSLKYQVLPSSESFVTQGKTPNSLIISPTSFWNNGATTITILDTTMSDKGLGLKNPQSYVLKTDAPAIPANLQGGY